MKTTKTLRARPNLEGLEERCNPAPLIINGTAGNDTVVVSMQFGAIKVVKNNVVSFHNPAVYDSIVFNGFAGNDYFRNDTAIRSAAYGHAGHDTLIGGSNRDVLDGGFGSDHLYGRDGNDLLIAGLDYSFNYLDGGDGNDVMQGGYGIDWMFGRAGNDTMVGNAGNDRFDGGLGLDSAWGGLGADVAIACEWTNSVP